MSIKQDRTGTRTSEDLRRRLNVKSIDENKEKTDINTKDIDQLNYRVSAMSKTLNNTRSTYISTQYQEFDDNQKEIARSNIGAGTSSFSGSYEDLTNKPTSLRHINLEEGTKLNKIEEGAQKNVLEKIYVAGVEQTATNKAINLYVDSYMSDNSTNPVQNKIVKSYIDGQVGSTTYFASSYAESGVSILRSNLEMKNNRVCFNFVGTKSMSANTTTTLFTFPEELRPAETRDFIVFGQTSNTDGYIGYGFLTSDGLLQVRFNTAITSYIRFSFVYDLY